MSWLNVAIGGAAVLGAGASIYGAQQQAGAANAATNLQAGMFQGTQQNLAPFLQTGQMALSDLASQTGIGPKGQFNVNAPLVKPFTLADFQQSPAYQFNLQQGLQAINNAAAARGNFYAPQTLQDVGRFSQGLASNEYWNAYNQFNQQQGNVFNRLSNIAGSGQNAAANLGGFALGAGGQMGQNITSAGAAQAAGTVGAANAISGGIGDIFNAMLMNRIISQGGWGQSTSLAGIGAFG